eukprot:TRINITY_DN19223_c0_g2_i1.p1 TRINITY_DN19223_c0_g2~~TRINITY_DN19223_c0_g2_i1.p1  ORF type:complete len:749 (+),score=143.15 TRINITY_DN19223_c0_g2_i1:56-2248(+)
MNRSRSAGSNASANSNVWKAPPPKGLLKPPAQRPYKMPPGRGREPSAEGRGEEVDLSVVMPTERTASKELTLDSDSDSDTTQPLDSETEHVVRRSSRSPSPRPVRPCGKAFATVLMQGYNFGREHVGVMSSWCSVPVNNFKLIYESTFSNGSHEGVTHACYGCVPLFVILTTEDEQILGGFHTSTLLNRPSFIFNADASGLHQFEHIDGDKLTKRTNVSTPTCFAAKDLIINPDSGIISSVFDRYKGSGTGLLKDSKTTAKLRSLHIFWGVPVPELVLVSLCASIACLAPPPRSTHIRATEPPKIKQPESKPEMEVSKGPLPIPGGGTPVISRPSINIRTYSYAAGCITPAPEYPPPPPPEDEEEEEATYVPSYTPSPSEAVSNGYVHGSRSRTPPTAPAVASQVRFPRKRSNSLGSSIGSSFPGSVIFTDRKYIAPAVPAPQYYFINEKFDRKPALPVEATRGGKKMRDKRAKTPPSRQKKDQPVSRPSGYMGGSKIHWATPGGWETRLCDGRGAKYDLKPRKRKKKRLTDPPLWREEVEEMLDVEKGPFVCPVTGLTYMDMRLLGARKQLVDRTLLPMGCPGYALLYNYFDPYGPNEITAEECSREWLVEVLKWAETAGGPRFRESVNMTWRNCLDNELMWEGQVLSPPRVDRDASDQEAFTTYFARHHPSVARGDSVKLHKACDAGCVRLSTRRSSTGSTASHRSPRQTCSLNPTQSILEFRHPQMI